MQRPSANSTDGSSKKPYLFLAIFATCLAGAVLRLYRIDLDSICGDEGYSYYLSTRTFQQMLTYTAQDVHPPLHYALLHLVIEWIGRTETAMRGTSAAFGVLTLWGIYQLGRRLFNTSTGLIAAVLLAVSPFQIFYSQQARMYTMLGAFCVLSFLALARLWEKQTVGRAAAYAVITALMLYTHYYAGFVVFGQSLFMLWYMLFQKTRRQATWLLSGLVATTVLYSPWLPTLASQVKKVHENYWMTAKGMTIVSSVWVAAAGEGLHWYFLAGLGVALFPLRWLGLQQEETARPGAKLLISLWVIAAIGIPVLISYERPIYTSRHAMPAMLGLVLLFSYGLSKIRFWNLRWILVAVYAVALATPLAAYYNRPQIAPWREVGLAIRNQVKPGEIIMYFPGWQGWNVRYYLENIPHVDLQQVPLAGETDPTEEMVAKVIPLLDGKAGAWLIEGTKGDPKRLLQSGIETRLTLRDTSNVGPFFIRHFTP